MAADRRVTSNGTASRMTESKIFTVGPFLIGASGACTTGQLLQEWSTSGRKLPKWSKGMDARTYLRAKLTPALRKAFKDEGLPYVGDGHGSYEAHDWEAIIAYQGRLFLLGGDGISCDEVDSNYIATGCGRDLCAGAMYVQQVIRLSSQTELTEDVAKSMLETCIAAAAAHDVYCGDGCDVVHQVPAFTKKGSRRGVKK